MTPDSMSLMKTQTATVLMIQLFSQFRNCQEVIMDWQGIAVLNIRKVFHGVLLILIILLIGHPTITVFPKALTARWSILQFRTGL